MRLADTSNFMLGQYIKIAVNDPKHYPKEPLASRNEPDDHNDEQMNEFDEAKINAMMAAFAQKTTEEPSAEPKGPQQANTQATAP